MKLVLVLLILLFIVSFLLFTRPPPGPHAAGIARNRFNATSTAGNGESGNASPTGKTGGKKLDNGGESEELVGFSDTVDDIYENEAAETGQDEEQDSGGFFGFLDNVAKSDWLRPFQPSTDTFRDPPPAPWDADFNSGVSVEEQEDRSNEEDDQADTAYGRDLTNTGMIIGDTRPERINEKKQEFNTERNIDIETGGNAQDKPSLVKKADEQSDRELGPKELFKVLNDKLLNYTGKEAKLPYADTCFNKRTISNSCDNSRCLQRKLPVEPQERVKQLINHRGLKLTTSQHAVLQEMASKVQNYHDVILLTTASSNHFLESQALLQNLHQNVFPALKNFTLLFYDLGLTPDERKQMEKYCRCQVLSFPFHAFPEHMQRLKCYAWKPVMINAHIHQANVVLWMDASIRFNGDPTQLHLLIQTVKERGVQIGRSGSFSAFRTYREMYHYFGDEPCAYLGLGQAKATIGGYGNEPFVKRVILEPWVACALHEECMCPRNNKSAGCAESKKMAQRAHENNGPIIYGLCHRFDQSAISLILHKLYQAKYPWVMMNVDKYGKIKRDHQVHYFKSLK